MLTGIAIEQPCNLTGSQHWVHCAFPMSNVAAPSLSLSLYDKEKLPELLEGVIELAFQLVTFQHAAFSNYTNHFDKDTVDAIKFVYHYWETPDFST